MNGKTGLALISLPAAVPAGALAVLLIVAFLSYGDNIIERMPTLGLILAGGMLLLSTLVFLMPAAIVVFGPKGEQADDAAEGESDVDGAPEPAAEADEAAAATQPEASGSTEEAELLDSDEAAEAVTAESDDELVAESDDFLNEWDSDDESEKK